jgi:hypothetical protein
MGEAHSVNKDWPQNAGHFDSEGTTIIIKLVERQGMNCQACWEICCEKGKLTLSPDGKTRTVEQISKRNKLNTAEPKYLMTAEQEFFLS